MGMKKLFLIFTVTFLLVSCNKNNLDCICTLEFSMITILVVDSTDSPVDSLDVFIEDEFGRQINPLYKQLEFVPGRYVVIDDSYTNYLSTNPLLLRFTASDSLGRTARAFIVVNTDECRCHVNKISGVDKVVLR